LNSHVIIKMASRILLGNLRKSQSSFQRSSNHYLKNTLCTKSIFPPLNVPLEISSPEKPVIKPVYKKQSSANEETFKITTLSNGLKVASEDSFGQFCTIGAVLDAGSRYEVDYPSGITHMLEKLAFQSTEKYENNDEITQAMEKLGGHVDCQAFRDCIIYAGSAFKYNIEGLIDILSQAMWNANIAKEEVDEQKQTIAFELESLDYRPDFEPQLTDLIHSAAFKDNTLGLPKLCPEENIDLLNPDILQHYLHRYYRPDRITIAGVNVNHDELVKHCDKYFNTKAPSWLSNEKVIVPDHSVAQYVGGLLKDHRPEPRLQPGITQFPELTHIAIGFESAKYTDPDMFGFAVLNLLLGGGGSFSAGGPGKGMYSRLYTNVLNRRHWMFSSTAYNHSYVDTGLFCIHSSAHPNDAEEIIKVITQEYSKLLMEPFNEIEVARAKKQTQSMLMMNLESRIVRFEDMGRQVLGLGERKSPKELYDSIEAVTAADLRRISEKMLSTKPSVAAIGNLDRFPGYGDVEKGLLKRQKGIGRYIFGQ